MESQGILSVWVRLFASLSYSGLHIAGKHLSMKFDSILVLTLLAAASAALRSAGNLGPKAEPVSGAASIMTYGACSGFGVVSPRQLLCTPDEHCTEGCKITSISTPLGQGMTCACDYAGPQPNCCRLAYVASVQRWTQVGDCNAPGCSASGDCTLMAGIQNNEIVSLIAVCESQP